MLFMLWNQLKKVLPLNPFTEVVVVVIFVKWVESLRELRPPGRPGVAGQQACIAPGPGFAYFVLV